ncbi:MBL fold metallo-hydrolase [Sphingopyxis fribergensis]
MSNISLRRLGLATSAALSFALIAGSAAHAEDAAKTPYEIINTATAASPVTPTALRGDVTLLEGAGGTIVALAGPDGLLLVDDGIAVSRAKIEAVLTGLRPGGLNYVINTHWHWDHTDGNGWAHDDGATIIAQRNTAAHLDKSIRVVEWGHTFDPVPAGYRPAMLVDEQKTMAFNGETIEIRHYMPSHTDGDLSVYFRKANVLATGDTWWNGIYPFIDYVAGGSIDGMIKAANWNIEKAGPETIVVPGHGPAGSRQELIAFRDMLVTIRTRVAALKAAGKSLEEAVAAHPTAEFDAKWGGGVINPALFTQLVYRGV